MAKPKKDPGADKVTYRELRNTPGQVWERLANDEPLTLYADGEAKALLIPVVDGDVRAAYEAFMRGRAMLAAARIRRTAIAGRAGKMTLADINDAIRATRKERLAADRRR